MFPLSYIYSIISLQKNTTKVLRIGTFLHNYYLLIILVPNTFSKKTISIFFTRLSIVHPFESIFFGKIKEISDGSSDFI